MKKAMDKIDDANAFALLFSGEKLHYCENSSRRSRYDFRRRITKGIPHENNQINDYL
jgi:hypothetical protein